MEINRKNLKHDKFVEEVGHSVEYIADHKSEVTKYGTIGAAVLVVAVGGWWFMSSQREARRADLVSAIKPLDAQVSATGSAPLAYPTQAEKDKAVLAGLEEVAKKHAGSEEGTMANYLLATQAVSAGRNDEAERRFKAVVSDGHDSTVSLAKFALAQLYASQGKTDQAAATYKELAASPSVFVSKEQATYALAKMLARTQPQESRKLVDELLKSPRPPVTRVATGLSGELPAAPASKP
ncbi:MAG: tetratricopeptide repeat protein [Acidobacteria bacterium]|nr:tetratricopeptide repeat protein [Acidobacteriota bacterium]